MLPENTYTIEQLIQTEKSITIGYNTLSFRNALQNGTTVAIHNVVNDYLYELTRISTMVELNDIEFAKYKFKPKLLCKDIYGNAELYFIILLINDMADVKEFDRKRIRMIGKANMDIIISQIYNADKKAMDYYNGKQ